MSSPAGRAYSATLVLGGARSGKSAFAEKLAFDSGLKRLYVATSPVIDDEMHSRVNLHKQRRGDHWRTVEEEIDLPGVLACESAGDTVILIDCLTLWLNNLMYRELDVTEAAQALCHALEHLKGPCVLVSNEVGMGIVPENRLSRSFRDAQGRLNQDIAAVARQVIFVAAGLPLVMKPSNQPDLTI